VRAEPRMTVFGMERSLQFAVAAMH
jgi:hypothetical protein